MIGKALGIMVFVVLALSPACKQPAQSDTESGEQQGADATAAVTMKCDCLVLLPIGSRLEYPRIANMVKTGQSQCNYLRSSSETLDRAGSLSISVKGAGDREEYARAKASLASSVLQVTDKTEKSFDARDSVDSVFVAMANGSVGDVRLGVVYIGAYQVMIETTEYLQGASDDAKNAEITPYLLAVRQTAATACSK